ncbi:MAG TPA: hypothetical protein VG188_05190 [Solirubrobacteraceae bacterium]|jgi:hypothetical protein|nr:hypothetical protein [Solirubrobacteraceae bacterium]
MAKLIYSAICSLDGYVEDEEGRFDWAAPDEEVHAFVNDLERPIGTYLYGLGVASAPCQMTSARDSSFSTSTGSETASFTSTTSVCA